MSFLETLNKSRFVLFFLLILLPAPLIGGVDATALFIIRVLILAGFLIYLIKVFLFRDCSLLSDAKDLKIPLIFFFLFLIYVFFQWQGGRNVFLKILPGTIQSFETQENFLQLVFYFIFFVLCLDFLKRRERVHFIIAILVVQTVFLVALGYYQELSGIERFHKIYGWYLVEHEKSFFSSFISANHYGGYLVAVSPLFLGSLVYYFEKSHLKLKSSVFFVLSIFLSVILAAITVSAFHAGARAAFVVQLAVLTGYLLVGAFRKRFFIFFFSFLAFGFIAFFLTRSVAMHYIQSFSELPKNLESRLIFSKESLGILKDFPFFGTGLGTYQWISKAYQITGAAVFFKPHVLDDYLELMTDTGIVGFLLWLPAFIFWSALCVKKCLKSPSRWSRIMGFSSFVAMGLLVVLSTVDYYLKTPAIALLFVFYVALFVRCGTMYVAAPEIQLDDLPDKSSFKKTMHFILFAAFLQLFVGLAIYSYREWRSEVLLNKGGRYFLDLGTARFKKTPSDPNALEALKEASLLSPDNPKIWFMLGNLYRDKAEKQKYLKLWPLRAMHAYQHAVEKAPTFPDYLMALGREKITLGRTSQGLKELARAVEWAPYDRDYYLYLICIYLRASENAPQNGMKAKWRREALGWLKKAQNLPIPLTQADHRYLNGGAYKLSELDERLILSLWGDLHKKA